MLYFYCVTQCFSLGLITHKMKLDFEFYGLFRPTVMTEREYGGTFLYFE